MPKQQLQDIAREISRQVANLRAARRAVPGRKPRYGGHGRGHRHHPPVSAHDPIAFLRTGGLEMAEAIAASEAAAAAVRAVRQYWLPILEEWLALEPAGLVRGYLETEVKRLRRRLGIKPTPAMVREQTRRR